MNIVVERHREWVQRQLRNAEENLNDQMELLFRGWVNYADVAQAVEDQKQRIREAHFLLR